MEPEAGYWFEKRIFSDQECFDTIANITESIYNRSRAGARHLMSDPFVKRIAYDPRMLDIAAKIRGANPVPFRATLFEKSGAANWLVVWHQDTALPLRNRVKSEEWGPWSRKEGIHYAHAPEWALNRVVALRLHLDPSHEENGPLKVIPSSHVDGVLQDDQVAEKARQEKPVTCLADRGDVMVMHPLLIHSSSKATSSVPRRVLHIEYSDSIELAAGLKLAVA